MLGRFQNNSFRHVRKLYHDHQLNHEHSEPILKSAFIFGLDLHQKAKQYIVVSDNFQAQLDNIGYINQKVNEETRRLRFEYQGFSRPPPAQREHATCSDCLVTEKTTGKLFAEYTFSYVNMPQNNANKDTFPPQAMCIK